MRGQEFPSAEPGVATHAWDPGDVVDSGRRLLAAGLAPGSVRDHISGKQDRE